MTGVACAFVNAGLIAMVVDQPPHVFANGTNGMRCVGR
jgi:hypothetical protein